MTWVTDRIRGRGRNLESGQHGGGARAGINTLSICKSNLMTPSWPSRMESSAVETRLTTIFNLSQRRYWQRGVEFATEASDRDGTKLFIHCAAECTGLR